MGWPIPDTRQYQYSLPRKRTWILLYLSVAIEVILCVVDYFSKENILEVYEYISDLFFILILFSVFLVFYCYYKVVKKSVWDDELKNAHIAWEQWSREQLVICGNVISSPEEHSASVMLQDTQNIPAYPHKGRPLFGKSMTLKQRLAEIDDMLERQCPGYRYFLHTIYLAGISVDAVNTDAEDVFEQWHLYPEHLSSLSELKSWYDEKAHKGIALIIGIQLWPSQPQSYSEFISAQLITTPAFAKEKKLPVLAGLGRVMPSASDTLSQDLDMLFEYTGIDREKIKNIWLSKLDKKAMADVSIYACNKNIPLPLESPYHLIDHTFGPPGPVADFIALALLADSMPYHQDLQLLVKGSGDKEIFLCLMTRKIIDS